MDLSNEEFRSAMSLYPTGVAIVTTESNGCVPFGITVNSFTSLSLDPPLVMWNLDKTSDTFDAWFLAETFGVNFLKENQRHLAVRYSRKGEHQIASKDVNHGVTGCPLLADVLASIECKVRTRYEGGDHVIIIGEVIDIVMQSKASPLVFYKGTYSAIRCSENRV